MTVPFSFGSSTRTLFFMLTASVAVGSTSVSQAAVRITISGVPSSSLAMVSLSGDFTAEVATQSGGATSVAVPVAANGGYFTLGFNSSSGAPTTNPFKVTLSGSAGAAIDDAMATYFPTVGVPVVASANDISFLDSGVFAIFIAGQTLPALAVGDMINFSGSFDLDLGTATFEDTFNVGTHVGNVGADAVTVVVTPVPEPSSALLLGLTGLTLLSRRRR